jgi:hypothetical protein
VKRVVRGIEYDRAGMLTWSDEEHDGWVFRCGYCRALTDDLDEHAERHIADRASVARLVAAQVELLRADITPGAFRATPAEPAERPSRVSGWREAAGVVRVVPDE